MLNLIIKDYLQNLRERDELDFIFPILLEQMGYKVVKTAKSSHGQPEYGKDIIAIGKYSEIETLYIFQLKAGKDKDINKSTLSGENGIRESLIQSKDVKYVDSSIPNLNDLPRRYVLVHPGEIKSNCLPIFEGFVNNYFPDGNFERWGISELTEYFSNYLLNEYILSDVKHVNLLKKTLAFIDVSEYDFRHFKILVDSLLEKENQYHERKYKKMMATLCLISQLVIKYSKESDNLIPARDCLAFLLLRVWGWILKHKVENERVVIEFFTILDLSYLLLIDEYISKILPIAQKQEGLFSEKSSHFEKVGYPLRSFEFLGYYIFYIHAYFHFYPDNEKVKKDIVISIKILFGIIKNNCGCSRPLLDNHSIPIVLAINLFISFDMRDEAIDYIQLLLNNLFLLKKSKNRFPELYNNIDSLIETVALGEKTPRYYDSSSYLILVLFELITILNDENTFQEYWNLLTKDVHLLTYYPPQNIVQNEHILYQKELKEEGYTEIFHKKREDIIDQELISDFNRLKEYISKNKTDKIKFRTDQIGFGHLRILAHIYFKTPLFIGDWRPNND